MVLGAFPAAWAQAVALHQPMTFTFFWPCSGTASVCGPMVLAEGVIESDTPARFREFLAKHQVVKVAFNSPGGNLIAGLELGSLIRAHRLDTLLAPGYERVVGSGVNEDLVTFGIGGVCASACAYAFLGGVSRRVEPGTRFGLHQFAAPGRPGNDAGAQSAMVELAMYVERMGVDRGLLYLAGTTPHDDIVWLTPKLVRDLQVDNSELPLGKWRLVALGQGELGLVVEQARNHAARLVVGVMPASPRHYELTAHVVLAPSHAAERASMWPLATHGDTWLEVNGKRFVLKARQPWQGVSGTQNRFEAVYELSPELVRAMALSETFWLNFGFSNANRDLDPSGELGNEGLAEGFQVLERFRLLGSTAR